MWRCLTVMIPLMFFVVAKDTAAAVIINEIAWMGTESSANDEWIELYNTGPTEVGLDGWEVSDGMNLSIALSGTLSAGSHAVLERTDDDSAHGAAFLIYTGALPNTGATMRLYRADGSIEDQVAGGENWELIGGDNVTKETAQYTSSGWITAAATPGRENASTGSTETTTETSQGTKTTTTSSTGSATTKAVSAADELSHELTLTFLVPTVAYVGQPVTFTADATGLGAGVLSSLRYSWNFGDLGTAKGEEVSHTYRYPGKYIISARGAYGEYEAIKEATVTILPVDLSITHSPTGDLQLHNDAKYTIDLSRFTVAGIKLPDRTKLLAGSTLTIPKRDLAPSAQLLTTVYDSSGTLALMSGGETTAQPQSEPTAIAPSVAFVTPTPEPYVAASETTDGVDTQFVFAAEVSTTTPTAAEVNFGATDQQAAIAAAPATPTSSRWPYLGLVGVLLVGSFGLLVRQ